MISEKKIEPVFCKDKEIKDLIESILEIKRQKGKENKDETPAIKLGRRLVQRSNKKLSRQILEYLIERYDIDNNKLPTKEELIDIMINFLGNIQKTPNFYNLKNEKSEIVLDNSSNNIIGKGLYGKIHKYKLDSSQTKKDEKCLAYKDQIQGIPYTIDVHFTSAILLVLYGFQPKYYNQFFMEIGSYENKNKQRVFQNLFSQGKNIVQNLINNIGENIIEKNIKWFILFNFTNISDQVHNSMKLLFNNELIKIDLRCLNTEQKYHNSNKYIYCFERYRDIFDKYKNEVINELNKLLAIKEEFLINFILFRTERGCFNVSNEDLVNQIGYISSCYKVLKISESEKTYFKKIFTASKKNFEKHFEINPTFTWMLYLLFKLYILTKKQYFDYVDMFNSKSNSYEKIAKKIREGKYPIISLQQNEEEEIEEEIESDNNIKEVLEENIKNEEIKKENKEEIKEEKKDERIKNEEIKEEKKEEKIKNEEIKEKKKEENIKNEEIKEEKKEENIKNEEIKEETTRKEIDGYNGNIEIKDGKSGKNEENSDINNDIIEIKEKIDKVIEKEEKVSIKEKEIKKVKNSFSCKYQKRNKKNNFLLKNNDISFKSSNNIIKERNRKKSSLGKSIKTKKHKRKRKTANIKLAKPKFAFNKIIFSKIKTENNRIDDNSRNNNILNNNSLFTEINLSEINSNKSPRKKNKFKKLDLSYNWKKVPLTKINNN